jgi:hypothetical protein
MYSGPETHILKFVHESDPTSHALQSSLQKVGQVAYRDELHCLLDVLSEDEPGEETERETALAVTISSLVTSHQDQLEG